MKREHREIINGIFFKFRVPIPSVVEKEVATKEDAEKYLEQMKFANDLIDKTIL